MKIIEIREDSHKKILKNAKEAKMIICELIETLKEQCELSKYNKRDRDEDFEDEEDDDEMEEIRYRGGSYNMRRNSRSSRGGRYSY